MPFAQLGRRDRRPRWDASQRSPVGRHRVRDPRRWHVVVPRLLHDTGAVTATPVSGTPASPGATGTQTPLYPIPTIPNTLNIGAATVTRQQLIDVTLILVPCVLVALWAAYQVHRDESGGDDPR